MLPPDKQKNTDRKQNSKFYENQPTDSHSSETLCAAYCIKKTIVYICTVLTALSAYSPTYNTVSKLPESLDYFFVKLLFEDIRTNKESVGSAFLETLG